MIQEFEITEFIGENTGGYALFLANTDEYNNLVIKLIPNKFTEVLKEKLTRNGNTGINITLKNKEYNIYTENFSIFSDDE